MEFDSDGIFSRVLEFGFVVLIKPGAELPCLRPDDRIQPGVESLSPPENLGTYYVFLDHVPATGNGLLNCISKKPALALRGAKRSASEDFFQFAPYGFRGNCGVFNGGKHIESGFPVLGLVH